MSVFPLLWVGNPSGARAILYLQSILQLLALWKAWEAKICLVNNSVMVERKWEDNSGERGPFSVKLHQSRIGSGNLIWFMYWEFIFQERSINPTSLENGVDFSGKVEIKLAWIWTLGRLGAICLLNCAPRQRQRILNKPIWERRKEIWRVPPCPKLARTFWKLDKTSPPPSLLSGEWRWLRSELAAWSLTPQQASGQAPGVRELGSFTNKGGKSHRWLNPWVLVQAFKLSVRRQIRALTRQGTAPWGGAVATRARPLLSQLLPAPWGKERRTGSQYPSPVTAFQDQARAGIRGWAVCAARRRARENCDHPEGYLPQTPSSLQEPDSTLAEAGRAGNRSFRGGLWEM